MIASLSTVFDCSIIELNKIHDRKGNITSVEERELPFPVMRIYYLYDVPVGSYRGAHAHRQMHHLMIAIGGSFDVVLNDGLMSKKVFLNNPNYGLHIPPGIWTEVQNFSSGATSLNLVSTLFDENDYIRNYEDFISLKRARKKSTKTINGK